MVGGIEGHQSRDQPREIFRRRSVIDIDAFSNASTHRPEHMVAPKPGSMMHGGDESMGEIAYSGWCELCGGLGEALDELKPECRRVADDRIDVGLGHAFGPGQEDGWAVGFDEPIGGKGFADPGAGEQRLKAAIAEYQGSRT